MEEILEMKKIFYILLLFMNIFIFTSCRRVNENVLVVGYDDFSGKFSPFFATTGYDMDVVDMTSVSLLTTDRDGGIIYNAIEGETVSRGGNEYFYQGVSNLTVNYDANTDRTTYRIKIRDDVKFSDGHVMDADDIIFTYYVFLDPYYAGSTTLNSVDIVGYQNYKFNSSSTEEALPIAQERAEQMIENIGTEEGDEELEAYIREQIKALLTDELQWITEDVITDPRYEQYWRVESGEPWGEGSLPSATATFAYFYALTSGYSVVDKTPQQVVEEIAAQYDLDYKTLDEYYGSPYVESKVELRAFEIAMRDTLLEYQGQPVHNISGIKKLSQTEVEIIVNGFDAAAVYTVAGIIVTPLHYYGDVNKYDYQNNKFGFDNRTPTAMSTMEAKTNTPMGAGPYRFIRFQENIVYFESNENYYKGAPKIKYINFQVVSEANKVSAIANGQIDISNPSGSKIRFQEIATYGDKLFVSSIDNLGYGYVGINAKNVAVGGNIDSQQSLALRTALATVLSSQRYTAVNSYYGQAATVINYPISNTSWAAPKLGETGYEYAFSKNPDGSYIYGQGVNPATLSDSERSSKAKQAARLWLEAAGYQFTLRSGPAQFGGTLLTATAPTGAKTNYEIIVPAGGTGDHPAFSIVTQFANIMGELGITININDPSNTNVLWNTLDALNQELWAAAWGATIDPDLYQVYHSTSTVDGPPGTSTSNHYYIKDDTLDQKIVAARSTSDQAVRKQLYKECLDIIMDWAVEVPTYQRQNIIVFSTERIDLDTLTPDITTYWSWMRDIELLELRQG